MAYNLTNLTSATGLYDMASFANEVTEGSFMALMILAIFFVILMGMAFKKDFKVGLASASFISFVLAGILSFAGLVSVLVVWAFLTITAFSILYLYTAQS